MVSRRNMMIAGAAAVAAGPAALRALGAPATVSTTVPADSGPWPPGEPGRDYTPVTTPNGSTLPYKVVDGVKVFHLVAEVIEGHEFAPGLKATCWGYNGTTPGPTIEAVEGDRVRIFVTNKLPEPTTVHWHGVILPAGMDGVAGLSQPAIPPGETFKYEFTLRQHGTHMYHPHFDEMVQMAMGMQGMFVIHPRKPAEGERPDRDFAIMLSEWRIDPGATAPNPMEMLEFNVLTMNSKAFPGTAPLVAKLGQRVRIRLGNLGAMDHHPIHLHGYGFYISDIDGGVIPKAARFPANTVLVPVGGTRAIDFVADNPGDWAMHCHMTHHVMNQMGHNFPNLLGVRPTDAEEARLRKAFPGYMTMGSDGMGEMSAMKMPAPRNSIPMSGGDGPFGLIDMGGMFTILKVREGLTSYEDPGWYSHPAGTVAARATAEELRANGIVVPSSATEPTTSPAALVYTCRMHPEVRALQPGRCPKCGMTLVPVKHK